MLGYTNTLKGTGMLGFISVCRPEDAEVCTDCDKAAAAEAEGNTEKK